MIALWRLLLATALLASPGTAFAARSEPDRDALRAAVSARLAEERGDPVVAAQALAQLAVLMPDNGALQQRLLDNALAAGDFARAHSAANHLRQAGNYRLDARLVLFTGAVQRRDWAGADALLMQPAVGGRSGAADPALALVAPVLQGWLNLARKTPQPWESLLVQARRDGPDTTRQWLAATIAAAGGKPELAREMAGKLNLDSGSAVTVAVRLVPTLRARRQPEAADALAQRLAQAVPQGGPAVLATDMQTPVLTPAQGMAQWFTLLAEGVDDTRGGNSDLVLLLARVAGWLDPAAPDVRLTLVDALAASGLEPLALAETLPKRRRGTTPAALVMRRAELLGVTGDHDAALTTARASVAQRPDDINLLIRASELARTSGDGPARLAAFDALLAQLPDAAQQVPLRVAVKVAKADQLNQDRQWGDARAVLEQALVLAPNDAQTLNYLGYSALERREDPVAALAMIQRAWEQEPDNAAITDSLGWAHFLLGNHDAAVLLLEAAVQGDPDSPVIEEHLGDAYWRVGRRVEARYAWRSAALRAEGEMMARLDAKLAVGLTDATVSP